MNVQSYPAALTKDCTEYEKAKFMFPTRVARKTRAVAVVGQSYGGSVKISEMV